MLVERGTPMVRRKNMDTRGREPPDDPYIAISGQFTCWTGRDSKNNLTSQQTTLLSENKRNI